MKKFLLLLTVSLFTLSAQAQENIVLVAPNYPGPTTQNTIMGVKAGNGHATDQGSVNVFIGYAAGTGFSYKNAWENFSILLA